MFAANFGRMFRCSCSPNKMVAYMQAAGVPIVVPFVCNQYVLLNWKMLFHMTKFSIWRNSWQGKTGSSLCEYMCSHLLNALMPVSVSMFVYIDTASAVKILACGSRSVMFFRSARRVSEFGRYVAMHGIICFIR